MNLTTIAAESIQNADQVVQALQDHLLRTKHSIPAIYLLDSIIKNVGSVYIQRIERVIIPLFKHVYRYASPDDKLRLQKLLGTWINFNGKPLFKPETLNQLKYIIPSENITARISSILHQKSQIQALNPLDPINNTHVNTLNQLLSLVKTTPIDNNIEREINNTLNSIINPIPTYQSQFPIQATYSQPYTSMTMMPLSTVPPIQTTLNIPFVSTTTPAPTRSLDLPQVSPNSLLNNLLKYGLISGATQESKPQAVPDVNVSWSDSLYEIPYISWKDIEKRNTSLVRLLYDLLDLQCTQCGLRMKRNDANMNKVSWWGVGYCKPLNTIRANVAVYKHENKWRCNNTALHYKYSDSN
jgi:hypothetical protein